MKVDLPLMKNVLTPLAKRILIPSGSTAAASATDTDIPKKIYESGMTILIMSNEEMRNIMEILKEQKDAFLTMSLGTLVASLLGNILADTRVILVGEETIRAGEDF